MNTVEIHGARFDVAAFSEQGPRSENQDAYDIGNFEESFLLALADGMGGEKSGRAAADTALAAALRNAPIRSIDEARRAVREANEAIARTAESDPNRFHGMGCALGLLALARTGDGLGWIAAHVGDVRILSLSPDGVLRLETRDHTPAFARWEAGEISLDEIADSAGANRLQRAVGRGGEADVTWLPAAAGWSWLIVSDGIYKAMRLDELATALAAPTASDAAEAIRRKVADRGPDDNFTAVVVRATDGAPAAAVPVERAYPMTNGSKPRRQNRSALAGLAAAIATIALFLAALALWASWETGESSVRRIEIDALRAEVDSLRAVVGRISDPFAPSIPIDTVDRPGAP
jgi:PPM family protein phosphatase